MGVNPITVVNLDTLTSSDRAKEMFANQKKHLLDNAKSYSPSQRQQHDITLSALESGKSGVLEIVGWPGHFIGSLFLIFSGLLQKVTHVHSTSPWRKGQIIYDITLGSHTSVFSRYRRESNKPIFCCDSA